MPDERRQELELERGELDGTVVDGDDALGEVDRQVAVRVGRLLSLACAGAPQQRLDARNELLAAERLDDVVVGAAREPADALELGVSGGQHQDRYVAQIAEPRQRLEAVEPRHRDVEDDEICRRGEEFAQPGAPVSGLADVVPSPAQKRLDERPDVVVVVDHEDARTAHTVFIPLADHDAALGR